MEIETAFFIFRDNDGKRILFHLGDEFEFDGGDEGLFVNFENCVGAWYQQSNMLGHGKVPGIAEFIRERESAFGLSLCGWEQGLKLRIANVRLGGSKREVGV